MGICSRRHFLLTICALQLLTTIERQVFDFLGFMWAPILVNFFNIIFVILGFFGAFQYRPKYIISYCVWNAVWLGWNVFSICFYLDVGILDKNSDVLNFGTGSFSWWQTNGPGCVVANEISEPEIYRPSRPTNVTDCVLSYEAIEVMHASTQCILGVMAIVGGICLSRVFLEEDDSFDFVGGDDFGLAGHTPLHPMYVSYSALSPSVYPNVVNSSKSLARASLVGSQSSFAMADSDKKNRTSSSTTRTTRIDHRKFGLDDDRFATAADDVDDDDDENIGKQFTLAVPEEYDSFDKTPTGTTTTITRFKRNQRIVDSSSRYSPVASPRMRRARFSSTSTSSSISNRHNAAAPSSTDNKKKNRIFTDHVREQTLKSFYSDPRLSRAAPPTASRIDHRTGAKVDRPLSLYGLQSKKRKKQPRPLYSIEYTQPEPPLQDDSSVSPKPMTPRRVKRRSVISRDGTRRSSRRSSVRQSRRKNPVNRIMEQQQQQQQENLYANTTPLTNENLTAMSQTTLNYDRIAAGTWDRDRNANWQPEAVNATVSSPSLWTPEQNYSNMAHLGALENGNSAPWIATVDAASTRNLTDNWRKSEPNPMQWQGQSNPSFQQTSTQSLNGDDVDEIYNNRPPSARSSYSNYHGVRATPQVPSRTDIVRQSQRQFVLSGPPAYQDTVI